MRWCISKPQSGIATVLDSAAYFCVILTRRPCYSNPCRSYQASSSSHLGVTRLSPSIYAYQTMSFAYLGVSCLSPSIPNSYPATPPPSVSYCVTLSPNILLVLSSCKNPAKVAQSCLCVTSWSHQSSLLHPPPSYHFSLAHTSNIGCNAIHFITVD